MRGFYLVMFTGAVAAAQPAAQQQSVQQIVQRSVAVIEEDWNQAPNFAFRERDVQSKHDGAPKAKSYEVLMIDGSPYNRVLAVDDQPLSSGEATAEEQKLRAEVERRTHESQRERNRRIARYQKERNQNHAMLKNMVDAFDFKLAGVENVNGHDCWVLDATPRPGYQPTDRETKVLAGMKGRLWIDKSQYQWVKVEAEVIKPVSFFGVFAKVAPGTRFLLEQAPVSDTLWLPSHFNMKVNASALGFINENSTDDEKYEHYTPIGKATALSPIRRQTQ